MDLIWMLGLLKITIISDIQEILKFDSLEFVELIMTLSNFPFNEQ